MRRFKGNRKAMQHAYNMGILSYGFHMEGEGGSGNEGGEGGEGGITQADMDAAIAAAVDAATTGLKNKNSELIGNLKKSQTNLKAWDGLEPDSVKNMLSHFENDQDLKDIAEGKHQEVIDRRLEKERAKFNSQIENLTTERDELQNAGTAAQTQIRDLIIDSKVVSEFVKVKGLEGAIPDVILRAKSVFTVEEGEAVARDSKGEIMTGKNGALTISEWAEGLKISAPHFFPASEGGDSQGAGAGKGDVGNADMNAAIQAGDMAKFRKLRKEQIKNKNG